jgi:hypothetical protein
MEIDKDGELVLTKNIITADKIRIFNEDQEILATTFLLRLVVQMI